MAGRISGTGSRQFYQSYEEAYTGDRRSIIIHHESGLDVDFTIKSKHILIREGRDYPIESFIKEKTEWTAEMI